LKLLLDTHILLWWHADDPRLGSSLRDRIAAEGAQVKFSVASLWEIAVKARIGKLKADIRAIVAASEADGFDRLDIAIDHLEALGRLPAYHRDPFDHLLIAQAISEDLTMVTADRRASSYPVRILCP
jgi:PIN domain nuclease of toxin-antitoxin system